MQSVFVLIIFFAVVSYLVSRSNKKNDIASKTPELKNVSKNELAAVKEKIVKRAAQKGVDYSEDEIEFILKTAMDHSGMDGVIKLGDTFESAPDEVVDQIMMKIEKEHLFYLVDKNEESSK